MKYLKITLVMALLVASMQSNAQMKIGYVNVEMALLYMPETKAMNQMLETEKQEMAEKLQVKYNYYQTKLDEYNKAKESGTSEAIINSMIKELETLQSEISEESKELDNDLLERRQNLMQPITEKLQKNLDELRVEKGYTYILNTVDGSGVSIVLSGPEKDDMTIPLLERMGIKTGN